MSQNTQQQVSPEDVKTPANQDTTQLTTPTTSAVGLDSLRSSYAAQQEAQIQTFLQSHGFESSTRIYQNSLTGSHVYRSTRNGADVVIKVSVPTVFQDAFGSVKFSEDYAKGEETSLRKVAESSQRLYPGERLFPALQGRISDGNELHGVVLEYIPGKNGQEYLESLKIEDRQMSTDQLVTFLRSGLAGVHCLQDAGLRHRDLNLRNIIIDETGEVKIIDLNFSKQLNQTAFTTIEPEGFYPPDAYGPQASGLSVDSYAIGMMALSLFTQQSPFFLVSAKGEVQLHDAKLDPALKNFLKKLCATNPKDRFADPQSAIRALDKIAKKLARAGRVDKSSATEGVVAKVAEPARQVSAVDVSTGASSIVTQALELAARSNSEFVQDKVLKLALRYERDALSALERLAESKYLSIRYRVSDMASRYGDKAIPVYLKLAKSDDAILQLKVLEVVKSYDQPILPVLELLAGSSHTSIRHRVLEIARSQTAQLAHEMVDSYKFDEKTGVSTFTVPAGVTDVEAMKALNEYFRKNHPSFDRDAVDAGDLEWFENLPKEFPNHCEKRDYSQARQITITGVVKDTKHENRTTQGSVLRDNSLVFSDPRDQAIAAALHACKHDGQDLFKDLWVRGSVPGFRLYTHRSVGVNVYRYDGVYDRKRAAASGSPSPELKKT